MTSIVGAQLESCIQQ